MNQSPSSVYPMQLSLLNFTEESRPKLQEYICPLCKGIYIYPIIDSCAHIFCKNCFELYLSNQKKEGNNENILCPLGKIPLDLSKIKDFDFISDIIKKQKIYCKNKDKGCQWIGLYELYNNHMKDDCLFQEIKCKNEECDCHLLRKDYEEHQKVCEYSLMVCPQCNQSMSKKKMQDHENECPKKQVKCECGLELFREELEKHKVNDCIEQETECSFNIYGCKERIKRKEIEKHNKEEILKHNNYFLSWFNDKRKTINEQLNQKRKRIEDKKEKIDNYYSYFKNICSQLKLSLNEINS